MVPTQEQQEQKGAELQCPDCTAPMLLREGKHGFFYGCTKYPKCTTTHGAHKDTGKPLGVPGDAATRKARIEAHEQFDKLWRGPSASMQRSDAYVWLRETLGLNGDEAHIGAFSKHQCTQLIAALACRDELEELNKPIDRRKVLERRTQKQKQKRRRHPGGGWVV